MGVKFDPVDEPWIYGHWKVQTEQRRYRARRRYRVSNTQSKAELVMDGEELYDLAEVLDEVCEHLDDEEEE